MLASVSLAIMLGPRIVHAEEGQTPFTKSDSNSGVIKQHLTNHLVKSVDAIQVTKDVLTEKTQLPSKVKKEVTHTVTPVHNIINGAEKVIKESDQHLPNNSNKVQPKGDVRQPSTIKTQKHIHTKIQLRDSVKKVKIHPKLVNHHQMGKSILHRREKSNQDQNRPNLFSKNITQLFERSNPSGSKTNNDSYGSNFLGFLDKHWIRKNISLKDPAFLSEKSWTQWENAPPSPPPELSLRYLS